MQLWCNMQSALIVSTEDTLVFSLLAHPAQESDGLFPIGTSRRQISRQIRELTRNKVIGGSGILLRSLLQDSWPSFKIRYAQTFFLAIYVYKYKRHIKMISFISSVCVALTDFNHRVI